MLFLAMMIIKKSLNTGVLVTIKKNNMKRLKNSVFKLEKMDWESLKLCS